MLLDRLIGYRGFKALAFLGGSADRVFAIDTDLNKPYWNVQLNYAAPTGGPPPVTRRVPRRADGDSRLVARRSFNRRSDEAAARAVAARAPSANRAAAPPS